MRLILGIGIPQQKVWLYPMALREILSIVSGRTTSVAAEEMAVVVVVVVVVEAVAVVVEGACMAYPYMTKFT